MHVVEAVERANRIARVDARAAPQPHADDVSLLIAPEAEAVACKWPIILIAPNAKVNVTDQRQTQPFARTADSFDGERARDASTENRTHRFAITARNVQAIMKPGVMLRLAFASDLAQSACDFAPRGGRIERPARRNGGANFA